LGKYHEPMQMGYRPPATGFPLNSSSRTFLYSFEQRPKHLADSLQFRIQFGKFVARYVTSIR
jgi:hypothetical protein